LKITDVAHIVGLHTYLFPNVPIAYLFILYKKWTGLFWATFSQTRLVTLPGAKVTVIHLKAQKNPVLSFGF
jgi:hypothetical protein